MYDFKKIDIVVLKTSTLESGINVAPGKFGKKNKRSPIYTLYMLLKYEVRNKAVAPGKSQEINKRRGTFIPDSRVIFKNSNTKLN